jgi:hypothetical protein
MLVAQPWEAEQRKPFYAGCIHDRLEIANEGLVAEVLDGPVGETIAPFVIADQQIVA